jgi:hypothetical protein
VAAFLLSVSACGNGGNASGDGDKEANSGSSAAADLTTCKDHAKPVDKPEGGAFPGDWPFPPQTVVFHTEDRGSSGTIVSAVTSTSFKEVLAFMNHQVVKAGFEVESGETEEHDAEAEWEGNGHRGRWAIRESASCPGETVVQVVSVKAR